MRALYHHQFGAVKTFSNKTLRFIALAIAGLFVLSQVILLTLPILAAPTTVDSVNMGSWVPTTTTGGNVEFVALAGSPSGSGAAKLTTINDNDSRARLFTSEFNGIALSDVTEASYSSYVESASNPVGSVSYSIMIDIDGDLSTTDDFVSLNHEPYWQNSLGDPDPVIHNVWQTWDVDSGLFWARNAAHGFMSEPGGPPLYNLADLKNLAPNGVVVGVGVYIGSYNPSYTTYADLFSFNGVEYDFEPYVHTTPMPYTQTTQIVLQSDFANASDTWTYHDDNETNPLLAADPNPTANHEIATNPVVSTGDNGAVRLTSATGDRWNLASLQYSGTRLVDIAALGFNVYTDSPGKAYINLDVDFNHPSLSGWQGRLVYVPSGVTANTWSSHEAVASNGLWQWSKIITGDESVWPDGSSSATRTWNDIVSAFPYATVTAIDDAAFGSLYLRADGESVTHYDKIYLATATKNVLYNFELPDTTKPNIEILSPPEGSTHNSDVSISVRGTDTESGLAQFVINIRKDGSHYAPCYNQNAGGVDEFIANCTFNISGHPDGVYSIRTNVRDVAGNLSSTLERTFVLDRTGPNAPVITFPNPEQYFTGTPILNQWTTATDISGVSGYQVAYRYDDGHTFGGSTCVGETIAGQWVGCRNVNGTSRNHTPNSTEQGGVTIWVRAIDGLGNVGPWSNPIHYYYDQTPPAVPTNLAWTDSNSNDVPHGGSTNLYSGTASWDASTSSDVDHYIYRYWNNIGSSPYNDESTAWATNVVPTSLPGVFNQGEGTHFFCVAAVDNAGNQSACSTAFEITYDATAPAVAIDAITTGDTQVEGIVDSDAVTVEVSFDNGTTWSSATYTPGDTTWTAPIPTLSSGVHTVLARATDAANNVTTPPAEETFEIGEGGNVLACVFTQRQTIECDEEEGGGGSGQQVRGASTTADPQVLAATGQGGWLMSTIGSVIMGLALATRLIRIKENEV